MQKMSFTYHDGTGIASLIPYCSADCIDLIQQLLTYDPEKRISAKQALKHPYFKELREVSNGIIVYSTLYYIL